ncbi:MAG: beta-galactosidase [Phycisphaerales bacterium JB047]
MASVSFDSRTLSIDGKRIWLVSGSIHFQRIAPSEWADRILQARHAGLNCIEVPIFWSQIETRPGHYDFKENNDIRRFIELIGEAGMHCVLRVGPYVGEGWDLGGLPAWLLNMPDLELRKPNQPFLESVGKYFNALAKQVKDLQASVTRGGPIVLVQNENHWFCGDAVAAKGYLGELGRYLREAGFTVPKINANNLWEGVEGDIDSWSGAGDMFGTMRQLKTVRPDQPQLVIDYGVRSRPVFGQAAPEPIDGLQLQRQLAEIVCAGGQYNLGTFSAGITPGFFAGRAQRGEFSPFTSLSESNAMLDEHGRFTQTGLPVRRLNMFASSFSRVLAHTEHEAPPIVIDPASDENAINGHVVTHMRGTQGSVVFIFSPPKSKSGTLNLLLSDGSSLPVRLGHQRVHWCLLDVHLSSSHTLDYTAFNALTYTDKMLVLFGPANAVGVVSINSTPLEVEVPKGRKPLVVEHEGMTLVVMSDEMADETFLHGSDLYVGVGGMTPEGEPLPSTGGKTHTHIDATGKAKSHSTKIPEGYAGEKLPKVSIGNWECAIPDEHIDGTSPRYAQIPGPADLSELGTPYGYGWYRVELKNSSTKKLKVCAPEMSDRVGVFVDAEHQGVLGTGPGADREITLSAKKDDQYLVMLADNMGRVHAGTDMTQRKGVYGHVIERTAFKPGKCSLDVCDPVDLLAFKSPIFGLRPGDTTLPDRVTWNFKHLKKSSIVIEMPTLPVRALVLLNEEPLMLLEADRPATIVLDDEATKRGNNTVQIAFEDNALSESDENFAKSMHKLINDKAVFIEACDPITDKGSWSFAKWEPPAEIDFDTVTKSKLSSTHKPSWWKSSFSTPDTRVALELDCSGLSKGQVYINGQALGRYFVSDAKGKGVDPSLPLPIPFAWLNEDGPNELLIFDEHGFAPNKVKVGVTRR